MSCYIYAIGRAEGPVKIGVSSHPSYRISTLQSGCHFKILLLDVVRCQNRAEAFHYERTIHEVLAADRLHGEWFSSADRALAEFHTVRVIEEYRAEQRP